MRAFKCRSTGREPIAQPPGKETSARPNLANKGPNRLYSNEEESKPCIKTIGFLLGLIFLIIYFKHYQKIINKSNNSDLNEPLIKAYNPFMMNNIDKFSDDIKPTHNNKTENIPNGTAVLNESTNCLVMPYISTELLDKAQNNIYDNDNYYKEIKNIENAYGVQGLNSDKTHYLAFDKNDINNNY